MRKDTIFPIASMTKPVAGVAILMLVEEDKVRLSDPVSRFIPEFRDTKVAIRRSTSGDEESEANIYTVPADREITVRNLMTHTSGLMIVLDSVKAGEHRSTGSFGWSGAFGTTFWVDWSENMTAILMVQTSGGLLRADFQNAVMQAIID
jgi:CubicO group peptidase (beta-lactamase class C family)